MIEGQGSDSTDRQSGRACAMVELSGRGAGQFVCPGSAG
jgi:hypothetical protein